MTALTSRVNERPFTSRVRELRRNGARLIDLERRSDGARSTTWFCNLLNSRSAWKVGPPPRGALEGLARLFETSVEDLQAMIACEWYDVHDAPDDPTTRRIALALSRLDGPDLALVEQLVSRLGPQASSPAV